MAMQQGKSGLAARYGGRLDQAVAKHKHDEADYGFQRLPPGISNGVAQLTKLYFEQYKTGDNKGEYYLRGEGVVVSPVMHRLPDGSEIKVAGLTTSIMRPMCQTKKGNGEIVSQDDNVANAMNDVRILGGDTNSIDDANGLETLVLAVQEARPYFNFATSVRKSMKQGEPDGVWENWNGNKGLEDYSPPDSVGSAVEDSTERVTVTKTSSQNGTVTKNGQAPVKAPVKQVQKQPEPEPVAEEAKVEYTDQGDIDSLVEMAEGGDSEAQKKLQEMMEEAGISDQTKDMESWSEAVEFYKQHIAQSEQQEQQEEEQPTKPQPKLKSMYKYKPMVQAPGGKKVQSKKAIDVEVIKVDAAKQTVDLLNMVNGKDKYVGVSWDNLE